MLSVVLQVTLIIKFHGVISYLRDLKFITDSLRYKRGVWSLKHGFLIKQGGSDRKEL